MLVLVCARVPGERESTCVRPYRKRPERKEGRERVCVFVLDHWHSCNREMCE